MSTETAGSRRAAMRRPLRTGFAFVLLAVAGALAIGLAPGARAVSLSRTLRRYTGGALVGGMGPSRTLAAACAAESGLLDGAPTLGGAVLPATAALLLPAAAPAGPASIQPVHAAPRAACRHAPNWRAPPVA